MIFLGGSNLLAELWMVKGLCAVVAWLELYDVLVRFGHRLVVPLAVDVLTKHF
jgi:hypothetical protein